MKELALTIGGTPIPLNPGVDQFTNGAGTLGQTVIQNAWNVVFFFAILLCLGYFIYGGITWVISQGDKKQVEKSHTTITYSLLGLGLVFFAFLIVNLVSWLFGVSLLGK